MSAPSDSNGRPSDPQAGEGVLANLPRTRPQRSSPRRAAARRASAAAKGAESLATEPKSAAARPDRKSSTRPGEAAPRKAKAARASTSKAPAATGAKAPSRPRPKAQAAGTSPRPRRAAPKPGGGEQVPRQGFESDFDRASGPVQPPGGAELMASAAEIVGELAKAGIATGERLLKDVLTRLPLS